MGALKGLVNVTSGVISKFGTTGTLTHTTASSYNATTGVSTPEERTEDVKGVKLKAGRYQKFSFQLVQGAEFGYMISSKGLRQVPEPHKVTVTLSDIPHTVLHVEPIDIGDDGVAAYILHCKR